jgi:CSLREA domain-containing protein
LKLRGLARLALVILPVAGAAGTAALPQVARAAPTIIVTTFADNPSADCTGSNGCSLRRAVIMANGDTGDVIQLGAGTYDLSIQADSEGNDDGTTGDLEIQSDMTIQGAGATQTLIRGVGSPWNDRIIEVDNFSSAPTATIQDLKVTGGNDTGQYGETDGGAILNDFSSLTLHNVIADTNHSDTNGGGVASNTNSAETFTISNTTLSNNTADGNGGGLSVGGSTSGVDSASRLFIAGNTASGSNQADAGGGGIYDDLGGTGSITFSDIMVVGNHATGMGGGGIYDDSNLSGNRPTLYQRITLSSNDAFREGGGFYTAGGFASLTNATITKNVVTNDIVLAVVGNGGGIAAGRSGHLTVNNATINGNSSPGPGGGAAALFTGDQIHLHNTILVKNTSGAGSSDCSAQGSPPGVIDSTGYNIVDDNTCALGQASDREGSSFNPNLGVLQDNTGPVDGAPGNTSPTLTEALPTGSIAIDTADPAGANNPATDERGVSRPQGTQSDVGAYEAIPPVFVAPILPAAGNAGSGSQSSTFWLLLILAAATALGAVGLRVRARS